MSNVSLVTPDILIVPVEALSISSIVLKNSNVILKSFPIVCFCPVIKFLTSTEQYLPNFLPSFLSVSSLFVIKL